MSGGVIIGIESTAHTLSIGSVNSSGEPSSSHSSFFRPESGGIHPREAADHHAENAGRLVKEFLQSGIDSNSIEAIAFSQGPGLGPCLRVGASVARALGTKWDVPIVGVNHCVAHIEIGRQQCQMDDPVLLYVSGGNTQVITRMSGRYRVLGETLDIGIGNMLDKFARQQDLPFPGGPKIEMLAKDWLMQNPDADLDDYQLPYAVQGMDLAFSGLFTAACRLVDRGADLGAVCWSLQEHSFAASIEVAERAMAHTGKDELLLGGGVACNQRLRDMSSIMCDEREGSLGVPAREFCVDNGSMIATLGQLQLQNTGPTKIQLSGINQSLRTDETNITWE
ncbi:MAG: UGMP family protein [Thermoplasmata archaeon]|nr:UGMP family protein [Thermoplasmata archaeon]